LIAGVLALLELFPELRRSRVLDDDQIDAIVISVVDALDDIHPNARSAGGGWRDEPIKQAPSERYLC
jgi:hypothetical protein